MSRVPPQSPCDCGTPPPPLGDTTDQIITVIYFEFVLIYALIIGVELMTFFVYINIFINYNNYSLCFEIPAKFTGYDVMMMYVISPNHST